MEKVETGDRDDRTGSVDLVHLILHYFGNDGGKVAVLKAEEVGRCAPESVS